MTSMESEMETCSSSVERLDIKKVKDIEIEPIFFPENDAKYCCVFHSLSWPGVFLVVVIKLSLVCLDFY